MADMTDRVSGLLDKVKSLGVCKDEAKEVRDAARAYDNAERQRTKGNLEAGAGIAGTAAGTVLLIACAGPQAGTPVCWATAGGILVGGLLGSGTGFWDIGDAVKVAGEAEDDLSEALDKLCECISRECR